MKKYEAYKPSGIEWIGDIPESWSLKRGRFIVKLLPGFPANSDLFTDDDTFMPLIRIRDIESTTTEVFYKGDYPKEYLIQSNDVLVGMDGEFNIAKWKGSNAILNQRVCKIIETDEMLANYAYYLFQTPLKLINDVTYSTTVKHLSTNDIKDFRFPVPLLSEQKAIAEYLDDKCAKIDNVVAAQRKRIELLNELKQSIITHAVTKGLDKTAKMKDSGIDWIGEVPETWEIIPFKHCVQINNGSDYKDVETDDEDAYPVIGSGGPFAFATKYMYDGEVVFLGRKGTVDKPLYFKGKFWAIDTMFYAIPRKRNNGKYLYYQSLTFPFDYYLTNTARPSMTQTDLGDNKICRPPLLKQAAIVEYLDKKCATIDKQIAKVEKQIELLNEYKLSVITECVTGKRKVF